MELIRNQSFGDSPEGVSPLSQGCVANMGHIDFWTDCLIPFWQSVIT